MYCILILTLTLLASSASAQSPAVRMWEGVGLKFGELIARKGMNCPEGKFAVPKGEDAYGKVYQVFCGEKGKPAIEGGLIAFRLTFKPDNDYLVGPWLD